MEKRIYTHDKEELSPDCFACNNPIEENDEVVVEDGETYCMPCAIDIGYHESDDVLETD